MHNTCHARQYVALAASLVLWILLVPSDRLSRLLPNVAAVFHRPRLGTRFVVVVVVVVIVVVSFSGSTTSRDPLTRNSTLLKIICRGSVISLPWQPETRSKSAREHRAYKILLPKRFIIGLQKKSRYLRKWNDRSWNRKQRRREGMKRWQWTTRWMLAESLVRFHSLTSLFRQFAF